MDLSSSSQEPPLVFFEGPWTERHRALIHHAVEVVERKNTLPQVPSDLGPPWVCQHIIIGQDTHYYMTSRFRMRQVLTARSVTELRFQLLEFAQAVTTFPSDDGETS